MYDIQVIISSQTQELSCAKKHWMYVIRGLRDLTL